ncbi:YcxB family protein [Pectinatus sottacetonis]|uniref:YcxB family protein n=1 Tax=Pectinatus sottacetonis TaxID=1002795 RepID=UPI0018C515D0|nr:YcxB family protein [Pectinatus sottacetonis]
MIWHNPIFILFLFIGLLLILTFPGYILDGYPLYDAFRTAIGFIPGIALTIIIISAPYLIGRKIHKKTNPIIQIIFNDDYMIINNSHKITKVSYHNLKKIRENKKYFFLTTTETGNSIIYTIDKNSFTVGTALNFSVFLKNKLTF